MALTLRVPKYIGLKETKPLITIELEESIFRLELVTDLSRNFEDVNQERNEVGMRTGRQFVRYHADTVALKMFIITLELEGLKNFLDHVTDTADRELKAINDRAEKGEFETFEDLEYAESSPFAWVEYASRAVYYELTALVENELHKLARAPWAASRPKRDGAASYPAKMSVNELFKKLTETKEDVSDLGFGRICKLIQERYGIHISEAESWKEVSKIRSVVNDLKHRGSYKHIKAIDWQNEGFPQRHDIEPDQARIAIKNVAQFFRALNGSLSFR